LRLTQRIPHDKSTLTLGTTAQGPQTKSILHFPIPTPSPLLPRPSNNSTRGAVPPAALPLLTMHPFDAASFFSTTPEGGSFDARQQEEELAGAASSSPTPSRGTRAGVENASIRCQDCGHRAKAYYCAHCCSDRGFVCPGHAKTPYVPASQCSKRQQRLAAVDVELMPISKRPHRPALPSVAAHTTTSSGTVHVLLQFIPS
jgi:LRP1 type putative zinc finger protein